MSVRDGGGTGASQTDEDAATTVDPRPGADPGETPLEGLPGSKTPTLEWWGGSVRQLRDELDAATASAAATAPEPAAAVEGDPAEEFEKVPDTQVPLPVPFGGPPDPDEEEASASAPAVSHQADEQEMIQAALAQELLGTLTLSPQKALPPAEPAVRLVPAPEPVTAPIPPEAAHEFDKEPETARGELPLGIREMPARVFDAEQSGPIPSGCDDLFGGGSGIMEFTGQAAANSAASVDELAHADTGVVDTNGVPPVDSAFAPTRPMTAVSGSQNGDATGPPPIPPMQPKLVLSLASLAGAATTSPAADLPRVTLPGLAPLPAEPAAVPVPVSADKSDSVRTVVKGYLADAVALVAAAPEAAAPPADPPAPAPAPEEVKQAEAEEIFFRHVPQPDASVPRSEDAAADDPPVGNDDGGESTEMVHPPKRKRGNGGLLWGLTIGVGLIILLFVGAVVYNYTGRGSDLESITACANTMTQQEGVPTAKAIEICKQANADLFGKK